ncbi:hypothetical protein LY78DRAFT_328051 [Colletotrichum sublineola]|nr:hypothetical protein LY78DRAFT_328051 [Colletotrichum sublineola]
MPTPSIQPVYTLRPNYLTPCPFPSCILTPTLYIIHSKALVFLPERWPHTSSPCSMAAS